MTRLFTALSAMLLISCGGGSGTVTSVPAADLAPVIKYVGTFEPNAPATGTGSLTIEPIVGNSKIGTREIAKVELSVNQGPPQVLISSNATNVTGQPAYAFSFVRQGISTSALGHVCSPEVDLEITATDVGGYAFKKYYKSCHLDVFGAFSDYGEKTVTYRVTGTAPTQITFYRYGRGGYTDSGVKSLGPSADISLKATDSDELRMIQSYEQTLNNDDVVTVSIEDVGGALATSTVSKPPAGASALLVCCGAGPVIPVDTHTVKFEVYTSRPGVVGSPEQFNFYYKVSDPSSGTVVSELSGSGAGFISTPIAVKAGYELRLEAGPVREGTYANVSIVGDSTVSPNSLGEALSNRPGIPAKLKVYCCKR